MILNTRTFTQPIASLPPYLAQNEFWVEDSQRAVVEVAVDDSILTKNNYSAMQSASKIIGQKFLEHQHNVAQLF